MKKNPLKELELLGQSIWLDYIKRDLFSNNKLKKLITEDSLRGMTSNPSIFEKSIGESHDYDQEIKKLRQENKDVNKIYEALTQKDVSDAAQEFNNVYKNTQGQDGYVSLEVNPHLAHDTKKTIEEARRLYKSINLPNIFIKVPATKEGIPAIRQLISEGININVTLLFSLERYKEVAEAYIAGLEERVLHGESISNIASVASFFLSRIDVLLDPVIEKRFAKNSEDFQALHGQIAIASAKEAYQIFKKLFNSDRFKKLREHGAHVQRLLWASTSTKNPAYSDIKYVEALIGPLTVNTLPLETIEAYRDHGEPKARLELDINKAQKIFQRLAELGISIDQATEQLEKEGVDKFEKSYDKLLETLKKKII